jgi:hypothetical protein
MLVAVVVLGVAGDCAEGLVACVLMLRRTVVDMYMSCQQLRG